MTLWQHAVWTNSNNPIAWNNLGVALGEEKRTTEAIAQFDRAIQADPAYLEPRRNIGIIHAQSGRLDQAIAQWEQILAVDPSNVEAAQLIAQARLMKNKDR